MPLDPTGITSHRTRQHRGVPWKDYCLAATTANITIATALNPGDTIDGVTLSEGNRVLVKNQSTPSENGIYEVAASPVRAHDMDQDLASAVPIDEVRGAVVLVVAGTVNAGKWFRTTTLNNIDIDTDDIDWIECTPGGATVVPVDHGNMGATETLDLAAGDWHRGTLDQACAITVQGFVTDEAGIMVFECSGDETLTWDADVDFGGGDDQPNASGYTMFVLVSSVGDSDIKGGKFGVGGAGVAALGDLTDVTLTSPVSADRLRYDGTVWRNSDKRWEPTVAEVGGSPEIVFAETGGVWDVVMAEVDP